MQKSFTVVLADQELESLYTLAEALKIEPRDVVSSLVKAPLIHLQAVSEYKKRGIIGKPADPEELHRENSLRD